MKPKYAHFIALILFLSLPAAAFAAEQSLGLVGGIVSMFDEVLKRFSESIHSSALKLAGVLLTVEVAYFWYQKWGSSEIDDLSSIFMLLLKHFVLIGFWIWAMNNSDEILQSIYNFFVSTGKSAAPTLDVDTLFSYGIELAQQLPVKAQAGLASLLTNPFVYLTVIIAQICLMVAFAVVAAQVLLAKIEFLFVLTAAPIYMAFGVFKFSRDWATKTMSHAVATGTKILMIYMLAGAMVMLADNWAVALQTADFGTNGNQLLEIIGASLVLIMLAFFVPSIANALMSGNTSLSGSSAIMGAMAVGAAATAGVAGAAQLAGAVKDKALSGVGSVKDFLGGMGGGAMSEFGSGSREGMPGAGVPGIMPTNSPGQAAAPADTGIVRQPSAPNIGNASTASIGGPTTPADEKEKRKTRDRISGAADSVGGVFSHGQNLASPFDDKTQVGGANIRVD